MTVAEVRYEREVAVALLAGDVDFASTTDTLRDLRRAITERSLGLVLDLSGTRYVDSAGIRMFFELAGQLRTADRQLGLAVPEGSPIRRLLKVTRVEETAFLCATTDECVDAIVAS